MQNRSYQVGKVRVEWGTWNEGMKLKHMPQLEGAPKQRTLNLSMSDTETYRELEKAFENNNPDWHKVVDILENDGGTDYNEAADILAAQLPARVVKITDLELDEIVMHDYRPKKTSTSMWATLFCCCGKSQGGAKRDYSQLPVDFDDDDHTFTL